MAPFPQLVGGALLATFTAPKHKVLLIPSGPRELLTSLYACKACDIVVLVVSAAGGQEGLYDAVGSTFLTALKAQVRGHHPRPMCPLRCWHLLLLCASQGMPAVVGYVQGLGDLPSKKSSEMLRYCTRFFQSEFGEDGVKLAVEGSPHQLIRCVANAKLRPMQWRSQRPCVVAHAVTFTPVAGTEVGTLTVTGYLRGQGLKQGCLLHIAEVGSFAAGPVSAAVDPEGVRVKEGCVFPAPPPAPPASVCPFEPLLPPPSLLADENPLEGEQTWPTRAELAGVSRKRAAGGGGGEESSEEDDSLDDDSDDGGDDEDEAGDSMEDSEGSEDGGALGAGADGGGDFSDMEDEPEPETKPGKVKEEEEAEKKYVC